MSRLGSHWSRAFLEMLAPAILCHKEPARSHLVGGFGCPSWFFMAHDCWRSNSSVHSSTWRWTSQSDLSVLMVLPWPTFPGPHFVNNLVSNCVLQSSHWATHSTVEGRETQRPGPSSRISLSLAQFLWSSYFSAQKSSLAPARLVKHNRNSRTEHISPII